MSGPPSIHALRQREIELLAINQKMLDSLPPGKDLAPAQATQFEANRVLIAKNRAAIIEREVEMNRERNGGGFEVRDGLGTFGAPSSSARAGKPRIGAKFGELFGLQALDRGGFGDMEEYLATVHSGLADPRLRTGASAGIQAAASEQTELSPSGGGFLVPDALAAQIIDQSLESEIVRPRCLSVPMTTNSRKIAGIDGYSHANEVLLGGVSPAMVSETDTLPLMQVKFWLLELVAKKQGFLINCSNELIEDSGFESVVGAKLIEAAAWELDYFFLWGSGAGVPRGIFNDPALIVVAKDSSQIAATITYNNICNMYARLHPNCRKKAVWVATSDCLPQLLQLALLFKNEAGTDWVGGSSVPIFTKGADGGWELLGLPVILTEKLQALGTQGDILLADLSQYAVGWRRQLTLERSMHVGFATDSLWLRLTARLDGMGTWKSAIQPPNGENTLSPFVTLATRS